MIPFNPLQTETEQKLVFSICDCALIAIATAAKALEDLRHEIIEQHLDENEWLQWLRV